MSTHECQTCEAQGYLEEEHLEGYVTRDMAIDAEDRNLEGYPIYYRTMKNPCKMCSGRGRFVSIDLAEVISQIKLGHEKFCLGVHEWTDEDGYNCSQDEWCEWTEVVANLANQLLILNKKKIDENKTHHLF